MRLTDDCFLCRIGDSFALIPHMDVLGEYHRPVMDLNQVEVFACDILSFDCTREELIRAVLDEFDVREEIVREDMGDFLSLLKDRGMLIDYD